MARIPVDSTTKTKIYTVDKGPFLGDVLTDGVTLIMRGNGQDCGFRVKIYSDSTRLTQVTSLTATAGRSGQSNPNVNNGLITVTADSGSDYSYKLVIGGLSANTLYYGTVWTTVSTDLTIESFISENFQFTTRPLDVSDTPSFNFVKSGCWFNSSSVVPFADMLAENPKMIYWDGDWTYDTVDTLAEYRTAFKDNLTDTTVEDFLRAVPFFYTPGDHDWGLDNYDGSQFANDIAGSPSARFQDAVQAMLEYVPVYEQQGAGRWHRDYYWGKHFHFIFLDCHSFRSTNASTDNSSKRMMGSATTPINVGQYLIDKINESTAPFVIICSPYPLYNDTTLADNDTFASFTNERAALYAAINNDRRVIWLTGDRHINQLHTIDSNNWWHLTCGPLNRARSWSNAAASPTGVTRDGAVFDTGAKDEDENLSYIKFVWDSAAKTLTFDYMNRATPVDALTSLKQKVLTMPSITNIDTDNTISWSDTNKVITGTGFKASQGTGKVYIGTSSALGTGTVADQSVDTWADTSIQIDPTQGGLAAIGTFYLFVVNSDNITSLAQQITVA